MSAASSSWVLLSSSQRSIPPFRRGRRRVVRVRACSRRCSWRTRACSLMDAHSTLRGLAAGAVEANSSPIAQWSVQSPGRASGVSAAAAGLTWWGAGVIACHYPRLALWTVVALNGVYAAVVAHNYRLGSRLLAR